MIVTLELLATIIAVKLWKTKIGDAARAKMKAFTDNYQRYEHKLPAYHPPDRTFGRAVRLDLEWISRDVNTDADDLSNEKCEKMTQA